MIKNQIDLNSNLNHILYNQSSSRCLNCGCDKEGKVINKTIYYKIITSRLIPLNLYICLEFQIFFPDYITEIQHKH